MDNAVYFVTTATAGYYPTSLWVTDSTGTHLVASYSADTTLIPVEEYDGVFVYVALSADDTQFVATLGTQESTHVVYDVPFASPATTQTELDQQFAILNTSTVVAGTSLGPLGAVVGDIGVDTGTSQTLVTIRAQSFLAPEVVDDFTTVGSVVYFVDSNAAATSYLYVTNGNTGGTTPLFAAPGLANLTDETNATTGERLFFTETATNGDTLLEAIAPSATTATQIGDFGGATVLSIVNAAGSLFVATQTASGGSLWFSDGSNAAPVDVQDFAGFPPTELTAGGSDVFFVVGNTLWMGSATGATELQAFVSIGSLYVDGATLFFAADDGVTGDELWSYANGTVAQVADIVPGAGGSDPGNFSSLNGELYFSATTPATGTELWQSDGTAAGTQLVADIVPGAGGSDPTGLTPGTDQPGSSGPPLVTYQVGYFGFGGTDGTAAGTVSPGGSNSGRPGTLTYTLTDTTLGIQHGTSDTSISVALPAPPGIYPSITFGVVTDTAGGFFDVSSEDVATYTGYETLYYIANTSLAPIVLQTFVPATVGDIDTISQRVTTATQEYFLLTEENGNYQTVDTQLWVSDGTAAGTHEVGDLGVVSDPGSQYPTSTNVIAGSFGWAGFLADTSGAVSLWTSDGSSGVIQITPAALGLTGTIDNIGNASLGFFGSDYLFSLAPAAGGSDAIATDGTAAGTQVIATVASGTFGDFTASGSLEYFDTGAGGALWVWNGTTATQLLAGGAYIAPYLPTTYGPGQSPVASTASVTVGDVNWFYFVAASGASYALDRTDGSSVQTVMASGLASNADITASGGQIFFIADSGQGYTTIFFTDPSGTTAAPVISPTLYPPGSLLAPYFGAPQNPTLLQAVTVTLPTPDTLTLTTGVDTATGGSGDTMIDATTNTLTAGDQIDGGSGINNLVLIGAGSFNLAAPASLLNITQVITADTQQTITLRAGTALTVQLQGDLDDTVIGADNSDTIEGASAAGITVGGNDETVLYFGNAIVTAATAGAKLENIGTVTVQGGGAVTFNPTDDALGTIALAAPTNVTLNFIANDTVVKGSTGTDTITIATPTENNGFYVVETEGGDDTVNILPVDPANTEPPVVILYDTGAHLNGTTVEGYNFTPGVLASDDLIDITDVAFTAAETVRLVPVAGSTNGAFNLVVSPDGTAANNTVITLTDVPVDAGGTPTGGFIASSNGYSGTDLTYFPTVDTLTTGADTISVAGLAAILAPTGTLGSGDRITGNGNDQFTSQATLYLTGAGTFDLNLPTMIAGLGDIAGDTQGQSYGGPAVAQTIILRDGLNTTVTLGAGADTVIGAHNAALIDNVLENLGTVGPGYTIDIGDAYETVELQGYIYDVINVDADTGLASVTDQLGSYILEGTEVVNGGGIVGIGTADVRTLELAAPTQAYLVGAAPEIIEGSTGTDLIDARLFGAGLAAPEVTILPDGGGDTIELPLFNMGAVIEGTAAQLNDTTLEGYNFLPDASADGFTTATTINVTDFSDAASVSVTTNGDVVTIGDGSASFTLTMPALPAGGITATVTPDAVAGVDIVLAAAVAATPVDADFAVGDTSFTGTAGNDVLNVAAGALAAGQTIDGGAGANELVLDGSGAFDLSAPATLTDFQGLFAIDEGQTITLRAGLSLDIVANRATIIGANSTDVITLESGDNIVVVNNPGATVIDGGYANTFSVSATTIGATIHGSHSGYTIGNQDTLMVTGGGAAVMGSNIVDVPDVELGQTGLTFYGNDQLGLSITISDAGSPDTVFMGSGGDTITDFSEAGGNILVGGAGNDIFQLGGIDSSGDYLLPPPGDTIYNFDVGGSDVIYLPTVGSFNQPVYANGELSLTDYFGDTYSVTLAGTYQGSFTATSAPTGGIDITFAGTVIPPETIPCFVAGTMIETTRGSLAVEDLREGDHLPVLLGALTRPIVWIGTRRIDCTAHSDPRQVWPVRVRAHAFGSGRPHTDLFLSPDHAVFTGDVLIPVRHLIDDDAIAQMPVDHVTYYHVELTAHDVLLAEGLPVESYLENGDRDAFIGAGRRPMATEAMLTWEALGCAPLVVTGPALEAARHLVARQGESREDLFS